MITYKIETQNAAGSWETVFDSGPYAHSMSTADGFTMRPAHYALIREGPAFDDMQLLAAQPWIGLDPVYMAKDGEGTIWFSMFYRAEDFANSLYDRYGQSGETLNTVFRATLLGNGAPIATGNEFSVVIHAIPEVVEECKTTGLAWDDTDTNDFTQRDAVLEQPDNA